MKVYPLFIYLLFATELFVHQYSHQSRAVQESFLGVLQCLVPALASG